MVTVMSVSRSSNYKAVPVILRHQTILKPCFLLGRGIVSFSPAPCLAGDHCKEGMSLGNKLGKLVVPLLVPKLVSEPRCRESFKESPLSEQPTRSRKLGSPISIPWESSFISVHICSQLPLVLSSWTWNLCWFLF